MKSINLDQWGKMGIASRWLLCIAALTFPFSVASTNIILGITIVLGLISGEIWQGLLTIWVEFQNLALALLAYATLIILGLFWSTDLAWGLHILSHQWFWFLLPLTVAAFRAPNWPRRFQIFLSISLTLHLFFCILQAFGWITVTTPGSSMNDPTGHIGHIGFGFVYGIWAAWLVHIGCNRSGWHRWMPWILALWSSIIILLAQGRSGYLVLIVLTLTFVWKLFSNGHKPGLQHLPLLLGIVAVIGTVLLLGPAGNRLIGTLHPPASSEYIDFQHDTRAHDLTYSMASTRMHLSLWQGAIALWREHPLLGVGTGGFPQQTMQLLKQRPELNYGGGRRIRTHPHNAYLLALARWGPLGLMALIWLLCSWIREGWNGDWLENEYGMLISVTGIALAVHGLTASSMEEHFSALLAIMLLGLGIAGLHRDRLKSPSS